MKESESCDWSLVVGGADRREVSDAFRGSRWERQWHEMSSPIDDTDPCSPVILTIAVPDAQTLIEALACVGGVRADYGTTLVCQADFGTFKVESFLGDQDDDHNPTGCRADQSAMSLNTESVEKLREAERLIGDVRTLIAVKGGGQ